MLYKRITFLTVVSLVLSANIVESQVTFQKAYGGPGIEYAFSVQQISDSGFIIAGYTTSFGEGSRDVYLIRTDKLGIKRWSKTYGGSNIDYALTVDQSTDGGFLIGAHTESFGAGSHDIYLIKTDPLGDLEWTRAYGGSSADGAYSLQQTVDGGYIISSHTSSYGAGIHEVYLIKINGIGDTLWTRSYGGPSGDYLRSVDQTYDGGYIMSAETYSFGAGSADVYLIKTDNIGNVIWTRTYGGTSADYGYSVKQTSDGGYIVAGHTSSFGAGQSDLFLIKTNDNGDITWSKTYGGTASEYGHSVEETFDGGFIVVGYTLSYGMAAQVYVIKTENNGNLIWSKTYGGSGNDYGWSIQQTFDTGYIITGYTTSFGAGSFDFYLIKTDNLGNSGCFENSVATIVADAPTISNSTLTQVDSGSILNNTITVVGNIASIDSLTLCDNLACLPCLKGDLDNNGSLDIADLTFVVDYMFRNGSKPFCDIQSDVNNDGNLTDISDLTYLVDFLFKDGPPPEPC